MSAPARPAGLPAQFLLRRVSWPRLVPITVTGRLMAAIYSTALLRSVPASTTSTANPPLHRHAVSNQMVAVRTVDIALVARTDVAVAARHQNHTRTWGLRLDQHRHANRRY